MRPKLMMPKTRRAQVGAGVLMVSVPATAAALAVGPVASLVAPAFASAPLRVNIRPLTVAYGHDVSVTGTAPSSESGQTLALEFAPAGTSSWRTLSTAKVGGSGHFRFVAPLQQSGQLKVTAGVSPRSADPASGGDPSSAPQRVTVGAKLSVPIRQINDLGGGNINVLGRVLPARAGRRVQLLARNSSGGGWHRVATATTGSRGGFDLRWNASSTGQQYLRVWFPGDRHNAHALALAGSVTVYQQSVASWYDDGGSTACGFHATYGVANRTLPCGTQVSIYYHGNTVTATVDDRGPYVGGRDWDLNQNTASALGFDGVDTVWVSQ